MGGTLNTRAGCGRYLLETLAAGLTKILQSGRGVGGTLNTQAGCGRYLLETLAVKHSSGLWEVPSRDSSSGSNKDTTIGAGCGRYLKHSSGLWEVPSRDSSS